MMIEMPGNLSVGSFRRIGGELSQGHSAAVKVDIKMWRLKELPVKSAILDFVLAELAISRIRKKQKKKCQYVN